jgi:hypothetical protein
VAEVGRASKRIHASAESNIAIGRLESKKRILKDDELLAEVSVRWESDY